MSKSNVSESVGLAIQAAREELGITQRELADRLNMKQGYISLIEKGQKNISLEQLQKFANALNVKQIEFKLMPSHKKVRTND